MTICDYKAWPLVVAALVVLARCDGQKPVPLIVGEERLRRIMFLRLAFPRATLEVAGHGGLPLVTDEGNV